MLPERRTLKQTRMPCFDVRERRAINLQIEVPIGQCAERNIGHCERVAEDITCFAKLVIKDCQSFFRGFLKFSYACVVAAGRLRPDNCPNRSM